MGLGVGDRMSGDLHRRKCKAWIKPTRPYALLVISACTFALAGCRCDDPRTRQAHAAFSDFGPPADREVTLSDSTLLNAQTPALHVARAALQAIADDLTATRERNPTRITDARRRVYQTSAAIVADLVPRNSPEAADPQSAVRAVNGWWTQRVAFYAHDLDWTQATVREDDSRAVVTVNGRSAMNVPHTAAEVPIEVTLTRTPAGWRVMQMSLSASSRTAPFPPTTSPAATNAADASTGK